MAHAQLQSPRANRRRQTETARARPAQPGGEVGADAGADRRAQRAGAAAARPGAGVLRTQESRDQLIAQYAVGAGRCAGAMAGRSALARGVARRFASVAAAGAGGLRAAIAGPLKNDQVETLLTRAARRRLWRAAWVRWIVRVVG